MAVNEMLGIIQRRRTITPKLGRVVKRLAAMIDAEMTAMGTECRIDPHDLSPAQRYWRTNFQADVFRWEGSFEVAIEGGGWLRYNLESWHTMSELIRCGLTIWRDGCSFECAPKEKNDAC